MRITSPFITKLYAPDDKATTGIELAEDEAPPQEEPDETETTLDKGKNGKTKVEKEEPEKETDEKEEELEIEGLEEREDGRLQFTVGDSVYISKEGLKGTKAVSDVLRQWREGSMEKDKSFKELKSKTSKEKADAAIRIPKNLDGDEDQPPPLPPENEIRASVLVRNGLVAGMDRWPDDKWLEYQEKNELKDWQISKLQRKVEAAVEEATKAAEGYLKNYNNHVALKTAETDVRDMLSEIDGVDPNDYADEFLGVIRRAKKDGLNAYGEISATWILKEMGKVVGKTLNSRQKSQLQAQVEKEIAENKERRRLSKPPVTGSDKFKKAEKKPMSIAEATRLAMEEERKRGNI